MGGASDEGGASCPWRLGSQLTSQDVSPPTSISTPISFCCLLAFSAMCVDIHI